LKLLNKKNAIHIMTRIYLFYDEVVFNFRSKIQFDIHLGKKAIINYEILEKKTIFTYIFI